MTDQLILAPSAPEGREGKPLALTPAQARLRKMVLDTVPSPHSKRNYGKASRIYSNSVPADLSPGPY